MKVKWKFWKSSKSKAAKAEKKRATKEVEEMPFVEEPNVHSVRIDENWRPPAPASGVSWEPRKDVRLEDEQHSEPYDPTDAFRTMDGLLAQDVSEEPPTASSKLGGDAFHRRTVTRSVQSLSTVSAGLGPGYGAASTAGGTALDVDSMVRQSMNVRGQPIAVGIVDPYDFPQPVFHKSFAAETGQVLYTDSPKSIARQASLAAEREPPRVALSPVMSASPVRSPAVASLRTFPSPPRSSRVQSPYSLSHKSISPLVQEALPPPPLPPPVPQVEVVPEPVTASHYESETHTHRSLGASELGLTFKPPTPIEPVPALPKPVDVRSIDSVGGAQFSRTNTSQSGSIHSRTYQRALNDPIPLKDPLPNFRPAPVRLVDPPVPTNMNLAPETTPVYESGGAALADANRALYGKHRHATERFYWNLPSSHDGRVEEILSWVEGMTLPLAMLGARRFIETHSRGALLMNVDYRAGEDSAEPAVDWITFDQSKQTFDKVLQESIGSYDPVTTTLVFVFLTSRSKNSVAMWRRKLPVPATTQSQVGAQLARVKEEIRREPIVVYIEPRADFPLGTIKLSDSKPPVPRPITRGPLIFAAQQTHRRPFDSTPSPPPQAQEVLAPSASMLRPNTTTGTGTGTLHQFPPAPNSARVHVFGESPASTTSEAIPPPFVVQEEAPSPPKKRRWWRRVFGGGRQRKKPKPLKLVKPEQSKRKSRMTVDWN